ncbi:MAG: ribonuclease E/G [Lachnospiraceae bacterium]|uniref:ribonuclease E/G n=1 Tax=Candidatus Merdisoma sp. JLR.KK011 TaxID=3114299 RepID=UPI0029DA434F|nr:ribonuclease E/G [Lachnospiraceae bacterium]MCI9384661.1 ribonuclease E/G [Lachnospiraceae bacterium]MCI9477758.1 ribonuclease E/G [Lachnospiraceae bacterium]MCI9621988.1 ribonuclease E/G [Lachnospiraceae bacterium]
MEQNGTFIITRQRQEEQELIVSAYYEDGKAVELSCFCPEETELLGSIYIGKVKNIVKNIEAAFIEIEGGILCYYSLREQEEPLYIKEKTGSRLSPGDELLVQVNREAVKTKAPAVTCNLNFPGKYLVLTTGEKKLGLSSKLSKEEKERLRVIAEPFLTGEFGVIVRTNAAQAPEELLREEFERLSSICRKVLTAGKHQSCFSRVYREPPAYAAGIRSLKKESLSRIITDDLEIYETLSEYLLTYQPEDRGKLRFYTEESPDLNRLYKVASSLKAALQERVWLKSGAYLIIQPTEALTVIDVNTGKYDGRGKSRETFLRINLEAARETARQLRLRNLSGIIVVDFIDMEEEADKKALMELLEQELLKDPVKTVLVDMTPLGLVEITRKKVRKTLKEQAKAGKIMLDNFKPTC